MTTANMGLTLPDVSVTPGPAWASQINSDLTLIDQHNHIPGANGGVPITSAALQIDADVEFNTVFPAGAAAKGLSYLGLLAPIGTANVPTRIRSDDVGDLYYDNASGIPVRLTNGASVAGAQGNISNLISPAAANYNLGTGTFEWTSSANTGAGMDSGPVAIRDGTSGSQSVTLTPPSGMVSGYTLKFPSALPTQQSLLGTSTLGAQSNVLVDSTLALTSSLLKVANNGITSTQLAIGAVTTPKIANDAVVASKIPDNGLPYIKLVPKTVFGTASLSATTNSTSPVVLFTLATTLTGDRPVRVELVPSGSGYSRIAAEGQSSQFLNFDLDIQGPLGTASVQISSVQTPNGVVGSFRAISPLSVVTFITTPPTSGSYTFYLSWSVTSGSLTGIMDHARLIAYAL